MFLDLRSNYGGGNEDNGDLLQKVRVMEGNIDTREKDISKLHFYLDAICSKAPVLEVTEKWSVWDTGNFVLPAIREQPSLFQERLKKKKKKTCCGFSLVRKNILCCDEGESQKHFSRHYHSVCKAELDRT